MEQPTSPKMALRAATQLMMGITPTTSIIAAAAAEWLRFSKRNLMAIFGDSAEERQTP
jgi:hypothetical protein